MRTLFLLFFLIFTKVTLAQERIVTFNHPCFSGLSVTVKNYGYLKDNKAYGWGIKIKNNYKRAVKFTYDLVVGNDKAGSGQPTYIIEPGDEWANDWSRVTLLLRQSSATEFRVAVWNVCFGGADCSDGNYFECDGRQTKDRVFGPDWKTKSVQNNNQNVVASNNYKTASELVNKKNELCTELGSLVKGTNNGVYALCQAQTYSANDVNLLKTQITQLENEIGRLRGANNTKQQPQQAQQQYQQQQYQQQQQQQERLRIAQENARRIDEENRLKAQQQQQYNSNFNQAQSSLQGGNYAQAMQGYANAANSATTSGDKKVATAGVVVSGLAGIADAMQKSSQQKRERQQMEAEAQLQKAKEDAQKELAQLKKVEDARKQVEDQDRLSFEKAIPVKSGKATDNNVTVKFVIDKNIEAIGGMQKLEAVKNVAKSTESDIVKTQSIIADGKVVFNNTYASGGGGKTVFNGVAGYTVSNNKKTDLVSSYIDIYKKTRPIDILTLLQKPDLLLGEMAVFRDKDCYTVIEKGETQKKHFFDTSSGLWIGTEQITQSTNNRKTVSYIYYDDYREVEGILFPYKQSLFIQYVGFNSEMRYTSSITKTTEIKVNVPLSDKDFE